MEYPFKDLMPLDEVLEREGYYKDWTHLDPEVFYSLTQISEYIKTKGYGVDVRLLIAQLAEHFGLKTTQVIDLANLLQDKFDNLEGVTQSFTNNINSLVAQMEADKDAVIANATVDSEVILARGGKATLGQRLDETTEQLAQNTTKLSNFTSLESAIIHAVENGNTLNIDKPYTITATVDLPSNLKIDGNKQVITVDISDGIGLRTDGSDIEINNLILDGNAKSRMLTYVKGISKRVYFNNVEIRNTYSDVQQSSGIQVADGAEEIKINNSYFHDIFSEDNEIVGDNLGSARGVLFGSVTGGLVNNSTFDNIGTFEDGDSIQVQATGGTGAWGESDVTITNNRFYNVTKRAIKLQASNCLVENNKIYSDFVGTFESGTEVPSAGISDYGSFNVIKNNEIYFKRAFTGIDLQNAHYSTIQDNRVEVDKDRAYEDKTSRTSQMSALFIGNSDNIVIKGNELTCVTHGIYSTNPNNTIKITDNIFHPTKSRVVHLSDNATGLTLKNNKFLSSETIYPYETVVLRNPEKTEIMGNYFEKATHPIRFYGVLNGVVIHPNVFYGLISSTKYRTSDVTEGLETLKIIGDYAQGVGTIPAGNNSVGLLHHLGRVPETVQITPRLGFQTYRAGGLTSSSFTVLVSNDVSEDVEFYWRVE